MKYYYISYFFKPNDNTLGPWGFGSTVCECTLYFDPTEMMQLLNKENNFECTIVNCVEINKQAYDNFNKLKTA